MRFVRERTEFVTFYIPAENETVLRGYDPSQLSIGKGHFQANTCFNVFWFKDKSFTPPICNFIFEKFNLVLNNKAIKLGAEGSVRLFEKSLNSSGSGFFLTPNMVLSNYHVIAALRYPVHIYSTSMNIHSMGEALCKNMVLKQIVYGHHFNKFPITSRWKGVDPILGTSGDFDYADVAVGLLNVENPQKVFFIPSPRVLQPNDEIVTLSYPGHEQVSTLETIETSYSKWAPNVQFLKKNVFNGFGKLCASVGKVLHPYTADSNGLWKPDTEFRYTSKNQECLATSECLSSGSSGGVVMSPDSRVYHVNGFTLIEFNAIHQGGGFVRCCDCLMNYHKHLTLEQLNKTIRPSHQFMICSECMQKEDDMTFNNPVPYSTSLSVHSQPVVELYSKLIIPELKKYQIQLSNIPSLVEYCDAHGIKTE